MADGFEAIYAGLRAIMLDAAPSMTVTKDEPGSLELRTPDIDPKTKGPGWFGTVTIKKSYVAFHLMPLYAHPEIAADISPGLSKRKQGKTCFNFSKMDEDLFSELDRLTQACARL
ncbi:hypothetical protein [Rhizorhabdus phycosphaerae]|uniref:hypothetical protein n=1 Tax=Rhizorhabdus phycosphaerae TaxID=2711156 RepID=UPI0013EB24F3|nr:hypothetical protein [Rhizorhabdus phycosphaerae]